MQITAIYPQHEQNQKRLHISINSEKNHINQHKKQFYKAANT